jgi:hypothetical protein
MRVEIVVKFHLILIAASVSAQEAIKLPKPTGEYAAGTVTYYWQHKEMTLPLSAHPFDRRQVEIRIWYPAEPDESAQLAPYAALTPGYDHVKTNSKLYPAFTNAVEKCPLILISPGRGMPNYSYTAIAEELASHGHVVASVGMPEIGSVCLPNGLVIRPNSAFRPSRELMSGPYEKVDEFFERPTRIGMADLQLALENITRLVNSDPDQRFTGKIDLTNIGVFGHSLGGRIAGGFVEANSGAVKCFVSMEGISPRENRLNGLTVPTAMLCTEGTWPYAKENYEQLIKNRRTTVYMIRISRLGHNSVSDFPVVSPNQYSYEVDPLEGLKISINIMRVFFDSYLKKEADFFTIDQELLNIEKHEFLKSEK